MNRSIITSVKFERKWKEEPHVKSVMHSCAQTADTTAATEALEPCNTVSHAASEDVCQLVGPQRQKQPLRFYMGRQMIFSFCLTNKLDHALDKECTYAVP